MPDGADNTTPAAVLGEVLDELETRQLLTPRLLRAARSWLPDIERKTTQAAKACGVLLALGGHLLDLEAAGDVAGVKVARATLQAFLRTYRRAAGPPQHN